jgi:tRNA nucleotidyltransferase (CCA-adding enzyme)
MMMRLNFPGNIYGRMCSDRECFVEAMYDLSEERELKPSEIYDIFSKQSFETVILLLAACSNKRMKEYVELYFKKYCASAKIELNGDDLIEMGMEPGASFNDIFKALRDARINGQVTSRDEEIVLVESQFLK